MVLLLRVTEQNRPIEWRSDRSFLANLWFSCSFQQVYVLFKSRVSLNSGRWLNVSWSIESTFRRMWRWFLSRGSSFCRVHVVKPIQLPLIILLWSFSISNTDKSSNNARFQSPGRLFLVLERSENSLVDAYWWQFDWVDCKNWWSNELFRQTSSYLSTPFNSCLKTSNQRSIILFYASWMCDCEKERSQIDTHHFIVNEALLMWRRKSLFRVFSSIMHAIFSVRGLEPSTSLSAYWTPSPSSSFFSLSPPLSLYFYVSRSFLFVTIYINSWNSN